MKRDTFSQGSLFSALTREHVKTMVKILGRDEFIKLANDALTNDGYTVPDGRCLEIVETKGVDVIDGK